MHSRAPALEQKASAAAQSTSPLQPPSPRSLSPHTFELPYEAALFHPRSAQLDAEITSNVGGKLGSGTGLVIGLVNGARAGAGTGLDTVMSAQQRARLVDEDAASQLEAMPDLVEPSATQ